jgi:LysR family transcriptional regulator for bpeEF and oprC
MAMDRLQAMEVFVRVVDTGGFTRAADVLRMPKATVTTLIQNLEAHLGVKLLNRTTRRVTVTPDGAAYYERCMAILAEIDETESALGHTRSSPRGRLRVDVPVTFGRRVLVPALPEFFARYPDIRLEVGCSDRTVDLIEEGVDCVVRGGVQPDSSLVARRVGTVDFVTCATPEYLQRFGAPAHPNELVRHHCINYFSARTGRVMGWDFTKDGERIEMQPEGLVALNDGEAYLEAGLAGLGIMCCALFMVGGALASGRLQRVLPGWRTDPLPVWVMYPQNRHLSAKVRVFVEWISDLFNAGVVERRIAGEAFEAVTGAAVAETASM